MSTPATAPAEASTKPTASTTTGRHTARRSRHGRSSVAAHSNGGNTTKLTKSGLTRTAGTPGSKPTTSPANTRRDGGGIRSRFANAATDRTQRDQSQDDLDTAHARSPA